jgi:hypothetical protein
MIAISHSSAAFDHVRRPAAEARVRRSLAVRAIRRARRGLRRVYWAGRFAVSAVVLVGLLAVMATIPIVNIYVLGYLLESEGRVGRGERWRNVLPWRRNAPRLAAIGVGTAFILLPLVVLAGFAREAALIDPGGQSAEVLRLLTQVVAVGAAVHLFLAYAWGGALRNFVQPIKNVRVAVQNIRAGTFGTQIAERIRAASAALQAVPLFWLGARGLAIAFAWLALPGILIAATGPADGARLLVKAVGVLLLAMVFPVVLILQAHFAAQVRLRAGFAVGMALDLYSRAPLAWLIAGTVTAVLALPLFLFKIIAPPRDALWLLTPLFVAAMLPARIVTGWAYRRAAGCERRRKRATIALAAVGLAAVGLTYAGGVLLAQYINEHGRWAVFEQHAFGLPVPF